MLDSLDRSNEIAVGTTHNGVLPGEERKQLIFNLAKLHILFMIA